MEMVNQFHLYYETKFTTLNFTLMKSVKIPTNKALVLILMVLLIKGDLYRADAQETREVTLNPVMKITNLRADEANPMRLDILKIDIRIIGQVAVTTMDMTYFNSNNRILEGELTSRWEKGKQYHVLPWILTVLCVKGSLWKKNRDEKPLKLL